MVLILNWYSWKTLRFSKKKSELYKTDNGIFLLTLWLYSLWLLHLDTQALTFFELFIASEAYCREAKKLSPIPSSANGNPRKFIV